jgi:predicted nucleotidyltransferase
MIEDNFSYKEQLQQELERILDILIKKYQPKKVILFGSLASGQIKETSDLDIFIIKDTPKRYWERIDEVLHLTHPQEATDLFVFTPEEIENNLNQGNLYLKEIFREGKILYERTN